MDLDINIEQRNIDIDMDISPVGSVSLENPNTPYEKR